MKLIARLQSRIGLPNQSSAIFWLGLAGLYLPIAILCQLAFLKNPLIEPHFRQDQTALTTYYFARHEIPFFDYRSPLGGELWNEVHELPVYQWICARMMNLGLSIEVASRGVSLVFFFAGLWLLLLIVRQLFDRQTASWAALLYAVSPLNILYSRAGLVDYPCLFFVFLSFWSLLKCLDPEKRHFKTWMLVFLVSGTLGATIKATLWMFPAIASFLYVAWLFWQRPEQRDRLVWMGTILVIQGVLGVAWTMYANDIQRIDGTYGRDFWIFGTFKDRLNPKIWKDAAMPLLRNVLYDWMLLPLLVGLSRCRKDNIARAAVLLSVIPFVLFLKVHATQQDYYFLIEAPFLFLLAALGLVEICRWKPRHRNLALALLAGCFVYKATKLNYVLGGLRNPEKGRMKDGLSIKALTTDRDIVLFDEVVLGSGYEITLYSERYLFFPTNRAYQIEPSVFYFDKKRRHFDWLQKPPTVWIEADTTEFYLYRVRAEGRFQFDAFRHIAVSEHLPSVAEPLALPKENSFPVSTCNSRRPRALQFTRKPSEVWVKSLQTDKNLILPGRSYLSLPGNSVFGCRFQVTVVEKPVPKGQ